MCYLPQPNNDKIIRIYNLSIMKKRIIAIVVFIFDGHQKLITWENS